MPMASYMSEYRSKSQLAFPSTFANECIFNFSFYTKRSLEKPLKSTGDPFAKTFVEKKMRK